MSNLRHNSALRAGRCPADVPCVAANPPDRWPLATHLPRCAPQAMTLVELMVVIVILTTLVAGVVPLLSPNNDTTKINEAARGLQSYITVAQAKAARNGRPAGVLLKKLSTDTGSDLDRGVCLEVFQLVQPVPFAGFEVNSTVQVTQDSNVGNRVVLRFGTGLANNFDGSVLENSFPPRMIKPGDIVEVGGFRFRIDDPDPYQLPTDATIDVGEDTDNTGDSTKIVRYNGTVYLQPTPAVDAEWIGWHANLLPPQAASAYAINRLPQLASNSAYQLPSGTCIDLQCSGLSTTVPTPSCCHNPLVNIDGGSGGEPNNPYLTNNDVGIAVMFGSDGSVSQYIWNDGNINNPPEFGTADVETINGQIFLLVGRRENVPTPITTVVDWNLIARSEEDRDELRNNVNWLNPDSRWVAISSRSGRIVSAENAFLDLSLPRYSPNPVSFDNLLMASVPAQMHDARRFAREMKRGGGG
ncbi:MAG: type II secretion system GspH family protein [Pirellulales bacterium]|nr:type II secretion system GspH family protein [Pirellulales bacterium]